MKLAKQNNAKKVLATMLAASMTVGSAGTIALADEVETGAEEAVDVSTVTTVSDAPAPEAPAAEDTSSGESAESGSTAIITVDDPEITAANE